MYYCPHFTHHEVEMKRSQCLRGSCSKRLQRERPLWKDIKQLASEFPTNSQSTCEPAHSWFRVNSTKTYGVFSMGQQCAKCSHIDCLLPCSQQKKGLGFEGGDHTCGLVLWWCRVPQHTNPTSDPGKPDPAPGHRDLTLKRKYTRHGNNNSLQFYTRSPFTAHLP